jgi:hypothetical protein
LGASTLKTTQWLFCNRRVWIFWLAT